MLHLQHAYDTKTCRRISKHALKPYNNRGLKSVVSVWYEVACDKIVPCKSAFMLQPFQFTPLYKY